MKCQRILLGAAGVMILTATNCFASDIKVIANSNVKADSISVAELKRVFLEERISLADGTHVEPVLEKDGPVHKAFLEEFLGVTDDDLQMYYRTLLFTGKGSIPKELGSDAEVVSYVARTRGAIGYVSSVATPEGVKRLVVGPSSDSVRKLIIRVEPDYPDTLKRLNIGGTVRLRISITSKGNVKYIQLLGGNPILAESAIAAVKKWIYAPGRSTTETEVSLTFGSR